MMRALKLHHKQVHCTCNCASTCLCVVIDVCSCACISCSCCSVRLYFSIVLCSLLNARSSSTYQSTFALRTYTHSHIYIYIYIFTLALSILAVYECCISSNSSGLILWRKVSIYFKMSKLKTPARIYLHI